VLVAAATGDFLDRVQQAMPVLDTACARHWELGIGSLGDPLVADAGGAAGAGSVPALRSL
jgi:hypothetical protein